MPSMLFATKYRHILTSVLTLTLLAGCANLGNKPLDTEEAYYQSAQNYLARSNNSMAIEKLTELQEKYPFGQYARASSLDLMYAYYQSGDYSTALIEADRFTRLNPDHEDVDYAAFIRAMSYFELYMENRGFFKRTDPSMRSPAQGQKAFSALDNFLTKYPGSDHRDNILAAMVVLKDSLARHELIAADYYVRKGAWIAAAERARSIVEHYPGVSSAGDALVILIEAYDVLDQPADKEIAMIRLQQSFPDHSVFASGEYVSPKWEEDRWWVKFFTLGLAS